jgi:hypothetical protein
MLDRLLFLNGVLLLAGLLQFLKQVLEQEFLETLVKNLIHVTNVLQVLLVYVQDLKIMTQ